MAEFTHGCDYMRWALPSGLNIIAVPAPHLHYFSVGAYVAMGPRFEPLDHTGISHFIEHMVFQGSKSYPTSPAVSDAVDRISGHIIAATWPEHCYFGLSVHRKYAENAIDILADVLQQPLFDENEIEQEKDIILAEWAEFHDRSQRNLSIDQLMYNLMNRSKHEDVSFIGTAQNIEHFDRELVVKYFGKWFCAKNIVLCVAGGFDPDRIVPRVEAAFSSLPTGARAEAAPSDGAADGPKCLLRAESAQMLTTTVAWPAVPFNHPDYIAYSAMSDLLGSGTNSRLFMRVREELGLVYDIYSSLVTWSTSGWFEIGTTVSTRNAVRTLKETAEVIAEFVEDGIDEATLALCREKMRCGLEISLDDPSEIASWYSRQILLCGPDKIITLENELREIDELSLDAIHRIARQTFRQDRTYGVVIGPVNWLNYRRIRKAVESIVADLG